MPLPAAQILYDYLSPSDAPDLRPADVIIGFGHFDLRIAHQCEALWRRGLAPRILFTGGVGAGSADLGEPEAEAFAATLRKICPAFPPDQLLIEPASTHTGDNVRFALAVLAEAGGTVQSAILVATPFRQRRVNQTWAKLAQPVSWQCAPPPSNLATDAALFARKGEDLVAQLPGEIERLQTYADRGWITASDIPPEVLSAAARL